MTDLEKALGIKEKDFKPTKSVPEDYILGSNEEFFVEKFFNPFTEERYEVKSVREIQVDESKISNRILLLKSKLIDKNITAEEKEELTLLVS